MNNLIQHFLSQLQLKGYSTDISPAIPGVACLLYAVSPRLTSVGPIKYFNHFLFVDWEDDLFSRLDVLIETHKKFQNFVNQSYKVPHVWRMTLPSLTIVVLSKKEFEPPVVDYVRNTFINPWTGGETGQFILIDLQNHAMICHRPPVSRWDYHFPLLGAQRELSSLFGSYVPDKNPEYKERPNHDGIRKPQQKNVSDGPTKRIV